MSLIVVGTMAFDAIETPFGKSDRIIGGAATYIALSASNFIKPIKQISVVGGDFPKEELDHLTSLGVELEGVQIKKDEKSFFWAGRYHMDMNERDTLDTQLNVLANFTPVVPESYQDAELFDARKPSACCSNECIEPNEEEAKIGGDGHHEFLDGNCH